VPLASNVIEKLEKRMMIPPHFGKTIVEEGTIY
jgi:hypothetical protein